MTTQPIYAYLSRIKDEEVRTAVRLIADALEQTGSRIVGAEQRPIISPSNIQKGLQATGSTPLNLVGLPGLPTLPLTTKGDLLTHNGTEAIRHAVGANRSALMADSIQVDGVIWTTSILEVLKAAASVGFCNELNFTEDGNVILTIGIVGSRITVGIQAVPGGSVAPFTTLFEWVPYSYNAVPNPSWANDLSLSYTGAGAYTLFDGTLRAMPCNWGRTLQQRPFQIIIPYNSLLTGTGFPRATKST